MFFFAIINNNQILNWKKYLNVKTSKIDDTYNNLQEYKPASDEELKKKKIKKIKRLPKSIKSHFLTNVIKI